MALFATWLVVRFASQSDIDMAENAMGISERIWPQLLFRHIACYLRNL